jgi:hypothetical protein
MGLPDYLWQIAHDINACTKLRILGKMMKSGSIAAVLFAAAFTVTGCAATDMQEEANFESWPDEGETAEGTPFRCERIQVTGTRQSERVCYSREQWEEQARRTGNAVRTVQDNSPGTAPPRPGGGVGG